MQKSSIVMRHEIDKLPGEYQWPPVLHQYHQGTKPLRRLPNHRLRQNNRFVYHVDTDLVGLYMHRCYLSLTFRLALGRRDMISSKFTLG